jgi:hypothetical protein
MTHAVLLDTIYADNLDPTKPGATEVLFCCVVNLPFRLRVGNSYAFPNSDNEDFKLYFRNPYKIPQAGVETDKLQEEADKQKTYNFFCTKVLIVLKKKPNIDRAIKVLNDFIIAYSIVCKSIGSFLEEVNTLNHMEFSKAQEWEIHYHRPKGSILTDLEVEKLLNHKPRMTCSGITIIPLRKFTDLSTQVLDKLPAAFTRHQNYVFYEFAFYARVRIDSEDYIGALLMACIALEGVCGTFRKQVRENGLSTNERKKERNLKKLKKVSRGSQFYERIKTTCSIFMKTEERPPDNLLAKCEKAIGIRDDIMHATYSKGVYTLRKYQVSELLDAYKVMTETYKYFKEALEKRQEQNQS